MHHSMYRIAFCAGHSGNIIAPCHAPLLDKLLCQCKRAHSIDEPPFTNILTPKVSGKVETGHENNITSKCMCYQGASASYCWRLLRGPRCTHTYSCTPKENSEANVGCQGLPKHWPLQNHGPFDEAPQNMSGSFSIKTACTHTTATHQSSNCNGWCRGQLQRAKH
jgi:hypothetical protein